MNIQINTAQLLLIIDSLTEEYHRLKGSNNIKELSIGRSANILNIAELHNDLINELPATYRRSKITL